MRVEVREPQVAQQQTTVGVGVGAHSPRAVRRERGELGEQPPVIVKQLMRPVTAHPRFELLDVLGVLCIDQQRHLVGAERALDR